MLKFSFEPRLVHRYFACIKEVSCAFLFSTIFLAAKSQQTVPRQFSKQLSLVSDNDFYLLQGNDGYYTNGLSFHYCKIHHSKSSRFYKQVDQFSAGQNMYTAYSRKIHTVDQIDRPVTGYLYLQFLRSDFMKNNQLFQWGISAGTIGKASLGEALQNSYHKLIHINTSEWGWVWDYQLNSAFGINLQANYAKALVKGDPSFVQVTPVSKVTLGTIFTNASEGILLQLGKIQIQHQSSLWNASLGDDGNKNQTEWFVYYYPELTWQLYNATIQGGLLNRDKGPIVSDPEPFVLLQQTGVMYSFSRYSLRLGINFTSKVADSQKMNHQYGTIQVNYRFN